MIELMNDLLASNLGSKAIIHARLLIADPNHSIPQKYALALAVLKSGEAFSPEVEQLIKAAFLPRETWLTSPKLKLVCHQCGKPVKLIVNYQAPWGHKGKSCGALVTAENVMPFHEWEIKTALGTLPATTGGTP
ncbi:MAG: hypothetical protein QNK37_03330 [Acidobacteriota bacterium]|nr:hypothetical protein [Acidobacteriota bacterium]